MPRWIELHDATIVTVLAGPTGLAIGLRAYVHDWNLVAGRWIGTGWIQAAVVRLGGTASPSVSVLPVDIGAGWVRGGGTTHDNLIPLPFASGERTKLWFELATAEVLEIEGDDIRVDAVGEAEFVESLSDDLKPFDG
jgi:hypothetical protein